MYIYIHLCIYIYTYYGYTQWIPRFCEKETRNVYEEIMVTHSGFPDFARKRRETWQREKNTDTTVKKNKDVNQNDDFLRHVRRRLEKDEVHETVSLELWKRKLDTFCVQLENVMKKQTTEYYDKKMDLFYKLQGLVYSSPEKRKFFSDTILNQVSNSTRCFSIEE